jgi:hypothetical protein
MLLSDYITEEVTQFGVENARYQRPVKTLVEDVANSLPVYDSDFDELPDSTLEKKLYSFQSTSITHLILKLLSLSHSLRALKAAS